MLKPPNILRTATGPSRANISTILSDSTAPPVARSTRIFPPAVPEHQCASVGLVSCEAGVSATDSPQPQAEVWFGLLKTKPADSLSILKSISVPRRNSTALG